MQQRKIPMLDLVRQQATLQPELDARLRAVVATGRYINTAHRTLFERGLADYCGRSHAIGVGSGTDALTLLLAALGVGAGDEVVTVPNSFFATTEAILRIGATPRFADVSADTHLMTPDTMIDALTPKTRVVLPVHLFGGVVDVPSLRRRLDDRGRADVRIVEDCAHAMGSRWHDRPVPVGRYGAFSFNPGKNMGALGDAGAIVTDDDDIATTAARLRDHGRAAKNEHVLVGFNSRLGALDDAVLALKLEHIDSWNAARRAHAAAYDAAFADLENVSAVVVPPGVTCARHQYVIRTPSRAMLCAHLAERGIATAIHYPKLIIEQPALANLECRQADVPIAAALRDSLLSLPCFPELTSSETEIVIDGVRSFAQSAPALQMHP